MCVRAMRVLVPLPLFKFHGDGIRPERNCFKDAQGELRDKVREKGARLIDER